MHGAVANSSKILKIHISKPPKRYLIRHSSTSSDFLTFNELTANRLDLDDKVTISQNAAQEPSSKLWLSAGQRVSIRTLIRGAAIRSANDAATALAEHISGSEKKFADYMTIAAREMGMSRTIFKNAHGLTGKLIIGIFFKKHR